MDQVNELYHYGIKGQEHGNRRYQNPDGTWTEEGKRRRRIEYESTSKEHNKQSSNLKKIKIIFSKKKTNTNKKESSVSKETPKEFDVKNYFDSKTNRTSAKKAARDIGHLSNSQIQEITNRINAETTLYEQVQKENQRKNAKYRKFMKSLNNAAEDIQTVNKFFKSVTSNPAFKYAMKEIKNENNKSNKENTK